MTVEGSDKRPFVPPAWFERVAWAIHRAIVRLTGGRRGLSAATPEQWGTIRIRTVGRTSGRERIAILGYHDDGQNIVTVAMNGWQEGDPGWWLNLKANPDATIELADGSMRAVRARAAVGTERERILEMFKGSEKYIPHRATETPMVVLEPR
jgi:deazaflavin-dependent oxidoreductase (nitroreductase family)